MLYRPPVARISGLAVFSARMGSLAVAVGIIGIVGFRFGSMSFDHAMAVLLASAGLGACAILLAAAGFVPIWEHGSLGSGSVVFAILMGLLAALPASGLYWTLSALPALSDVSTDTVDPPLFKVAPFARTPAMNKALWPSSQQLALQKEAYPDILTRHYALGSAQIFRLSHKIVTGSGWKISHEVPAREDGDMSRVEAVTRGLLSGSEADIVVRIYAEGTGTRVDMRSSSRWGSFDFGENANRIRGFFSELDHVTGEG